eukprot:229100_1
MDCSSLLLKTVSLYFEKKQMEQKAQQKFNAANERVKNQMVYRQLLDAEQCIGNQFVFMGINTIQTFFSTPRSEANNTYKLNEAKKHAMDNKIKWFYSEPVNYPLSGNQQYEFIFCKKNPPYNKPFTYGLKRDGRGSAVFVHKMFVRL